MKRALAASFWLCFASMAVAQQSGAPIVTTRTAMIDPPAGWTQRQSPHLVTIVAPEGDVSISTVDVGQADGPGPAIAAAWRLVSPTFSRKVRLLAQGSATQGWDESWGAQYETSPDEKLTLFARALRRADLWTVILANGADATFDKRAGAIRTFGETIRPIGFVPENFSGKAAQPMDAARREQLKRFWRDGMTALGIPGIGYAFVDRNGIIEEGGLGVKTLGKSDPVGAHTRFMIASNTKGMTTLLLAKLVDRGKLAWDEPVVQVDPAFRLGDQQVQQNIKVRHLICACTGMPRQDQEWIMSGGLDTPADRVFTMLAPMKPTSGFGEMFQYSNLLASAAGYIAGRVAYPGMETGAAYDKAMQVEIFDPLGMRDTTFSKDRAVAGDHADPHDVGPGDTIALGTIDKSDSIYFARPAGGAWSSAHDVALYALDELREGVLPSGKRLVQRDALLARRKDGVPVGDAATYGMGIETQRRWGVTMIHHGGAMPGYKTDWIIVPDAGVGVVLLANGELATPLLEQTRRRLVELLYGAHPEAASNMKIRAATARADYAESFSRLNFKPDAALVAKLARRYESPELGHIDVKSQGDQLIFDFGSFSSRIATRQNEDGTVSFVMVDPGTTDLSFVAQAKDAPFALVMRDAQHEYRYTAAR